MYVISKFLLLVAVSIGGSYGTYHLVSASGTSNTHQELSEASPSREQTSNSDNGSIQVSEGKLSGDSADVEVAVNQNQVDVVAETSGNLEKSGVDTTGIEGVKDTQDEGGSGVAGTVHQGTGESSDSHELKNDHSSQRPEQEVSVDADSKAQEGETSQATKDS